MNRAISGVFWIGLYLLVVLAPIGLMMVPPVPSGRGFWLEFSIALGFVGLTQIAVQFVLIARFRTVTAPYGIDVILQYHRQIALMAVLAILAHPVILFIDNPSRLELLNPFGGNWASRAGIASILCLFAIVITSVYRERLGLRYELWRLMHLVFGIGAIALAQIHVSMAGLYTNNSWKHAIWIVSAAAMVGLALYLRLIKPAWQRNYRWEVSGVQELPGKTWSISLRAVGHQGMRFRPGQFAWIKLAGSPFTLEEHPFSFSSSAERSDELVFGIKELGDFTGRLGEIAEGTRAYLDGPHGAFSIDRYPAVGYIFISGGIGITPMMSFLNTMADRKDPRPVLHIHAEKSLEEIAYRKELEELSGRLDLDVVYVLEDPPDGWSGESGFVTAEILERHIPSDAISRMFFVCGPGPMMDAVENALRDMGVDREQVQMEVFKLA